MPLATTVMTDSEKVLMLLMTLERIKNGRGCWCNPYYPAIGHCQECWDTQAAVKAALMQTESKPDRDHRRWREGIVEGAD